VPSYGIVAVYCPVHVERDQKYDVVSFNRLRSRHHRWPHEITEERPGNAIIRTLSPAGFALASDADDMNTPNSEVGPRIPSCLDPTCSGSVPTRRWRDCDSICFVIIGSGGLDVRFDMTCNDGREAGGSPSTDSGPNQITARQTIALTQQPLCLVRRRPLQGLG
jgi:hypothetical protein